jgi:N6-adenosine-specific RNA methylase IME4
VEKPAMGFPNPIIFQNADADITLLDIPTSIMAAQGDRADILLSTAPLESPIQLKEHHQTKTQTAKASTKVARTQHADNAHQNGHSTPISAHQQAAEHDFQSCHLDDFRYKLLVQHALVQIRAQVPGPWCMRRKLMTPRPRCAKQDMMDLDSPTEEALEARMREWASWGQADQDDTVFNLQQMMASLGAASEAAHPDAVTNKWVLSYRHARETESGTQAAETVTQEAQTEPWTGTFHNPNNHSLQAIVAKETLQSAPSGQEYHFTIPPRATLVLSDTTASDAFRTSFRQLTDEYSLPRHFDLVLLDPPWPNRSAKRKGAYEQVGGMPYLKRMLLNMDIDTYLEHNALVGVWITNKESLRHHVLGPGGLFETWNVGLMEEWIWVKTTTKGEPMFDIDNAMRKPYEILLLGRAAPNSWTTMVHAPVVKRRVIAAVPDIHSRKPCLKSLLEPYLMDPTNYSALEVFSRYLVRGWTSWGNEVLKYNWDGYWVKPDAAET